MKLQLPYDNFKVVPDTFRATIKTFNGYKVAVINGTHFVEFSQFAYDEFCKAASYCDYVDMLPDYIQETPIHTNESLLAYCYSKFAEWESIEKLIEAHKKSIEKLKKLAE